VNDVSFMTSIYTYIFYFLHPVRDWQEKIVPYWMIVRIKKEMENQW